MQAVAWRNLKRRKLRAALTGLVIALGVANVFGVVVANASINREIERSTQAWISGADIDVASIHQPGLTSAQVRGLQDLPGVRQVFLEGIGVGIAGPDAGDLFFVASIDRAGAQELVAPRLQEGRLPRPGEAAVALTRLDAQRLGVGIGDRVPEWTGPEPDPTDEHLDDPGFVGIDPEFRSERRVPPGSFLVAGILEDTPITGNFPGAGSYAIELSEELFEPAWTRRALVMLERDVDPSLWSATYDGRRLGDLEFSPAGGSTQLREPLAAVQNLLTGSSALAAFVGAFLIYLIFSLALVERTRTYGLLHAVGASPRQVASSVFREALALGLIATFAGLVMGALLARGLLALMAQIGGIGLHPPLAITAWSFWAAMVIGLGATVIGVSAPALRASRMSPVEAIRGSSISASRNKAWPAGVVLFLGGSLWMVTQGIGNNLFTQIAVVGVLLGAVLTVPAGVGAFTWLMHAAARRASPGLGRLAVSHITRERSRSAYTLALVMVVLAAMLTLSASNLSLRRSVDRWVDSRFGADLILYGPDTSEDVEEDVRAVDGVSGVTTVRFGQNIAIDSPVQGTENLVLIDPEPFFEIAGFPWRDGSDEEARRALSRGGSILIPGGSAHRLGLALGDEVGIAGPDGSRSFVVAGVYDFSGQGPETGVVASVADAPFFGENLREAALYVTFASGQEQDDVLPRLHHVLSEPDAGDQYSATTAIEGGRLLVGNYVAISGAQIKENARAELDGWIRLFAAVLFIVVIVGTLGMGTTLATSVTLRSREIGTIQAIGASSAGVVRLILAESVTLVVAAFGLSLGLGAVLSWIFVEGMNSTLGTNLGLVFPWRFLPILLLLALGIALVAGLLSARRAARLTPVEALRYE